MPFPAPYPPEVKEAAIELLKEAAREGKTKHQACTDVAREFTAGPSVATLMNWSDKAELFAKPETEGQAKPHPGGRGHAPAKREQAVAQLEQSMAGGLTFNQAINAIAKGPGMPHYTTLRIWGTDAGLNPKKPVNGEESPDDIEYVDLEEYAAEVRAEVSAEYESDIARLTSKVGQLADENRRLQRELREASGQDGRAEIDRLRGEIALLRDLVGHYQQAEPARNGATR